MHAEQILLISARAGKDHFFGLRGRQNCKFECARCSAFHLAQLFHERRQLSIGQRRMVFDLRKQLTISW